MVTASLWGADLLYLDEFGVFPSGIPSAAASVAVEMDSGPPRQAAPEYFQLATGGRNDGLRACCGQVVRGREEAGFWAISWAVVDLLSSCFYSPDRFRFRACTFNILCTVSLPVERGKRNK
jgi:hypothetical protein